MDDSLEYRPITDPGHEDLVDYLKYSFLPAGRSLFGDGEVSRIDGELYDAFGFYDGDTVMAVGIETDLGATVRGEDTTINVAQFLATPPEHRRRGVVSEGLPKLFEALYERETPFLIGREFEPGFYDHFGISKISNWGRWTCEPSALVSAVEDPVGEFRRLEPDSWERLNAVYDEYRQRYSISLDRPDPYWESIVAPFEKSHRIVGWERDGELRGYLVYELAAGGGGTIKEVDMGYVDHEAYRHLLHYLGLHEPQVSDATFVRPEDETVFDLVDRPGDLTVNVIPATILRTVDVPTALETISYPDGVAESVVLDVRDSLLSWNDRTFELSVGGGTGTCDPTEASADARLDVAVVSKLVAGYRDVGTLERIADLAVETDEARTALARMFPQRNSFVRDEV